MTTQDFVDKLGVLHPTLNFFNNTLDKTTERCIGVFAKGRGAPVVGIGSDSSYNVHSYTIIVRWSQNSALCENVANTVYNSLRNAYITGLGHIMLLDSSPVDLARDDKNVCEMAIRLDIVHERNN